MTSHQWNGEFLSQSQFTPVVRDGRTPLTMRTDDGRMVIMRATDSDDEPEVVESDACEFSPVLNLVELVMPPRVSPLNPTLCACSCKLNDGLPCLSAFDPRTIEDIRMQYSSMPHSERDISVLAKIESGIHLGNETERTKKKQQTTRQRTRNDYWLHGRHICRELFQYVHCVGEKQLNKLILHYKSNGVEARTHARAKKLPANALSFDDNQRIVTFISNYADTHAIILPGRTPHHWVTEARLLPTNCTKGQVHKQYEDSLRQTTFRIASERTFRRVWQQLMPFVTTMKPASDLCFTCQKDGGFAPINDHPIEMPDLDLYMRGDLVLKTSDVVATVSGSNIHNTERPADHREFDGTGLSLVPPNGSLLIHPNQSDLETNQFVTASNRQLPELVSMPQCLQSLGSSLDVAVSEEFQSRQSPQESQHHPSFLQIDEDQHLHHHHHHHHHHHLQHLDHHQQQQPQGNQSPPDLLLPQTIDFDSSTTHHSLSDQGMCHLPHQQQLTQEVSTSVHTTSQSHLAPCQDVHSLSSFHLHDGILEPSSLNSKLAALDSEPEAKSEECGASFHPSSSSLAFLPSKTNHPLSAQNGLPALTSGTVNSAVTNAGGKAKKRKLADRITGDMVWLNNKSLECRQRDRVAAQVLIEIVSQPQWQKKLNSSSTKKKAVWREIGQEFTSRGYFLENPGKKCFQKWRNLERSFREYEMSTHSSLPKSLPDFYEELRPILKQKLSLDGEKLTGTVDEGLMEKYVAFDDTVPGNEDGGSDSNSPIPTSSRNKAVNDHSLEGRDKELISADHFEMSEGASVARNEAPKLLKQQTSSVQQKQKSIPENHELMTSVLDNLKSQQEDIAQMNMSLQSIKTLMEEQKKEREAISVESKSRFLELKALIDKNQKEKMTFMYEFLKSIKSNQNHHNGEKP